MESSRRGRCAEREVLLPHHRCIGKNITKIFNFPPVPANYTPGQTNDSYQWNPCNPWTARVFPNQTTTNGCVEVAVCMIQEAPPFGTYHKDIGQQNLSDCVFDQGTGLCALTYGVKGNKQIKTKIILMCNETEEGRVDPMSRFTSKYETRLHSKCACPGRCSSPSNAGLGTGQIMGIVFGSVAAILVFAFVVFIVFLRRKLPEGTPKPPLCTTVKVGFEVMMAKVCPCYKRLEYSSIP